MLFKIRTKKSAQKNIFSTVLSSCIQKGPTVWTFLCDGFLIIFLCRFLKMMIFFKHWENTREKICFCADFKKQYFLCGFLKTWFFCADYLFFQKKLKNRFDMISGMTVFPQISNLSLTRHYVNFHRIPCYGLRSMLVFSINFHFMMGKPRLKNFHVFMGHAA